MSPVAGTLTGFATALALLGLGAPCLEAQPFAYIVNNSDSEISVLDTATNAIVAQIPTTPYPIDVAVDPGGAFVYAVGHTRLVVIDAATNTVVAHKESWPGLGTWRTAIHPTGAFLYVTLNIGAPPGGGLAVVDLDARDVDKVRAGDPYADVAVHPAGTFVYVTNGISDTVSVWDTATNAVVATVGVGPCPANVAAHPDGTRVYVAHCIKRVSVIDTATNTVTATLPHYATSLDVHPAGTNLYLGGWTNGDSIVTVVDTETNEVVARVSLGPTSSSPPDLAVHPAGTFVYVLNFWENTVSVIDTTTNMVTATVPAGRLPFAIAIGR